MPSTLTYEDLASIFDSPEDYVAGELKRTGGGFIGNPNQPDRWNAFEPATPQTQQFSPPPIQTAGGAMQLPRGWAAPANPATVSDFSDAYGAGAGKKVFVDLPAEATLSIDTLTGLRGGAPTKEISDVAGKYGELIPRFAAIVKAGGDPAETEAALFTPLRAQVKGLEQEYRFKAAGQRNMALIPVDRIPGQDYIGPNGVFISGTPKQTLTDRENAAEITMARAQAMNAQKEADKNYAIYQASSGTDAAYWKKKWEASKAIADDYKLQLGIAKGTVISPSMGNKRRADDFSMPIIPAGGGTNAPSFQLPEVPAPGGNEPLIPYNPAAYRLPATNSPAIARPNVDKSEYDRLKKGELFWWNGKQIPKQ